MANILNNITKAKKNKYKNMDSHLYIIVKNKQQPKGWFKIRKKYAGGALGKYKTLEFEAFHSAVLLKLYQANIILKRHIIPLFRNNPPCYFTEKSKHMHSKRQYSKHVIQRYLYLGSYFWSLCGALDNLSNEICVALRYSKRRVDFNRLVNNKNNRFRPIIKAINKKNASLITKQIFDFRNLFSHNAQFLHVVGWQYDKNDRPKNFLPKLKDTYLVGKPLDKLTSLFAQARQDKNKCMYMRIRNRYCHNKTTIDLCKYYYLHTKNVIERVYGKI